MILGESTWQEIRDADKQLVCLIPTGSLEQHGPHLPLLTDSLLAGGVAKLVEQRTPDKCLLFPTVWLGCSAHHMEMAGTATAAFETYEAVLRDVIESAISHGFTRFFVVNGHGGNTEPNGIALRSLKAKHPNMVFAHADYYQFVGPEGEKAMKGPLKSIKHACEAEASMMLHLYPNLVRRERLRDDGLRCVPEPPAGLKLIQHFDEITEEGSFGHATHADAETGRRLIELAVDGCALAVEFLYSGYHLVGSP